MPQRNVSQSIMNILGSSTLKHTSITTIGTVVNGVLGGLFYILLARFLGPVDFGIISLSILILTLVADVSDLGVDTSIVRFVSKYRTVDEDKAYKFLKLSLKIFILISLVILVTGIATSGYIAQSIFGKPELQSTLIISFFGVGTLLLFNFATSSLQAYEKFVAWSGVNILTNLIRVVIIIVFYYLSVLTTQNSMIVYVILPFIGFVGALVYLPKSFMKVSNEREVGKELFHYSKWVALFSAVAAVSSRLDTLMAARLLTTYELGIYSLATRLVQGIPQLASAYGTAIAPKFGSLDTAQKAKKYLGKLQLLAIGIVSLGLLLIFPAAKVIPFLLGEEYRASIPVFFVLTISMLVFLVSVPIHQAVMYYFAKPKLFFYLSLIDTAVVLLVGYLAITTYGIMGMAYCVLTVQITNFVIPLVFVLRKLR